LSLLNTAEAHSNTPVSGQEVPNREKAGEGPAQNEVPHVQLQASLVVRESCGANYRYIIDESSERTVC
ncbi:MAG: hypothetical protein JO031_14860, partial [Ktedonobacteraceae bacterium]|nr:hypothetical protein [Ktedonobacteraceae bacterium]